MKITKMKIPVHQRSTKFVNNLPSYWGKYVTIMKNSKYILTATQSTSSPSQYVPRPPQYAPVPQQAPPSTNDAILATMNLIVNLLKSVQRRALGNTGKQVATRSQGNKKGNQAEAFLTDVEYIGSYTEPLAITTTTTFEVSHEDAYDSNVDEGPHAAEVFMANLKQTGLSTREGSNNDTDFHAEVQTYDNHFFDNLNYQVSKEMHREDQLDPDVDLIMDDHDNTIPYHQYQLNNKVESVPTDVSSVLPSGISMITILDDSRSQLMGHIKVNEEQSFANDSLKAELERYKTQVQNLEQSKVKKDLEQLVCNNSNSPELNVFFKINKLRDQLQGKDDLIGKLKVQIGNMKKVSACPNPSTLEYQAIETENTQLKEELTVVKIKNDTIRDENVSIKKRYQDLYKSKAESNSNVSSGVAVLEKPKVLAHGLYAMTPKYVTP
uniref:Uncharacterized protein n=1 Tax=Tanacetum cinerariifolium TaxID=118510 RepID=A0A699GY32_TANCI|nr:hypothetical protein [Tanacetum cinerariifolium]